MDEALKTCPFCGNDGSGPIEHALHVSHTQNDWHPAYDCYSVQCDKCTVSMGYSDNEAEAIAAWNTRADAAPTPKADEVEAVARAIEDQLTVEDGWEVGTTALRNMCIDFAQAAIAALDAARGDAEPVAWRYVRKPEEWPPANPVVQSTRWLPDDPARPFWIEQPLYAHPPRGDQVARFVAHMKTRQPDEDVAECSATWGDFLQILEAEAEAWEPTDG